MTGPSGEAFQPPPEATLIRLARQARGLSPEAAAELTPIRLGGSRWREIEKGYKGKADPREVIAPDLTLAHMARTVGVTPERLDNAGRGSAAEILREILRQGPTTASSPGPYADLSDPLERAAWEADLPLEDRTEMIDLLRRGRQQEAKERPACTDLSDLVRVRRAEAGLSLEAVAAATADPVSGERLVEVAWLDRLERATLSPDEHPEYPQLDALVDVLHLDPAAVQEAAGAQFIGVRTVWSEDGQVRALVQGELSAEDLAKVQNLMRLYRRARQ
ncbi:helix-turn-helix domain-containing protein [Streptomyces ipomoeae]|uniref:helix-turn-helix domain-containing protein n=1 Tax=Streptomyces ipomoeae TaxID=103232 RepID=UPI00114756B7|nr:helix-turn-helix domain-containing protein [Streptomyces ipomoeae]TQE35441.1 hypothetical protein Sipo7851_14360 [Streptomyces ipomoeae]